MLDFPVRLGVHVSISGGIEHAVSRARELGCTAMQIFSRNPRGWKVLPFSPQAIAAFREAASRGDINPIVVHTPYLLNLASVDEDLHRRSVASLAVDMERAEQIGAQFVVTHLGSSREKKGDSGQRRVVKALRKVVRGDGAVVLLMENSSGAGNLIGSSFEELQELMAEVNQGKQLGVCFDSCHGYAAGYNLLSPKDIEALVQKISRTIGLQRLALLHLNDSAGFLGSHTDRHEHIGQGRIGLRGFRNLLGHPALRSLPMILETPKDQPEDDARNLSRIRELLRKG
jgi:deoxyribonuclease IV